MADAALPEPPPLRPTAVRGLVLDLDGTLVDSYGAITASLNAARAAFHLEPLAEAVVRRHVGRGLEALVSDLVGPDRVERAVGEFRRRYAEVYRRETFALPGVPATLRELRRRGVRLAVASNKPARFGGAILEHLGLRSLVDAVEGPDTAGVTKPHPEMLHRCLRAMEVAADAAAYVGDMVLDAESGARAGVPVLLVAGGSSSREDLERTGCRLLMSFDELLEILPGARVRGAESCGRFR